MSEVNLKKIADAKLKIISLKKCKNDLNDMLNNLQNMMSKFDEMDYSRSMDCDRNIFAAKQFCDNNIELYGKIISECLIQDL